jgi:protein DGCR14
VRVLAAYLAAGADVSRDHLALADNAESAEVLRTLVAAGARLKGRPCVVRQAALRDADLARAWLAAGAGHTWHSELAVGLAEYNPLHNAQSGEVVAVLVAAGASVHACARDGRQPLHVAASPAVVDALVAAGADVMARDWVGKTPLHTAHHPGVVRALLRHGTPLHACACVRALALGILGQDMVCKRY